MFDVVSFLFNFFRFFVLDHFQTVFWFPHHHVIWCCNLNLHLWKSFNFRTQIMFDQWKKKNFSILFNLNVERWRYSAVNFLEHWKPSIEFTLRMKRKYNNLTGFPRTTPSQWIKTLLKIINLKIYAPISVCVFRFHLLLFQMNYWAASARIWMKISTQIMILYNNSFIA